jgi:hypothetical protein
MNVSQVTVTIHEKRNHPHEYGHYDASVTLMADIEPGRSPGDAINDLRDIARLHVASELDSWINKIEEQRRIGHICDSIKNKLFHLRYARTIDEWTEQIVGTKEEIAELPDYLQDTWKEQLEEIGKEIHERIEMKEEAGDNDDDDDDDDDIVF